MQTLTLLLVVLLIVVGIWAFYRALRAAIQTLLNFYSWIPPETKELSPLDNPLPASLRDNEQLLFQLGFKFIGVTHTKLFMQGEGNCWHYIDSTGEIEAGLILFRNMVAFTTWFHDDALIQTYNPIGENIQTPNFHSRFTLHKVETAHHYHTQQVERWRDLHKQPVKFTSVSETLPYDAVYRRLYRSRHMQRLTLIWIGNTLVLLAMAISAFGAAYLYFAGFALQTFLLTSIGAGLFIMGGSFLLGVLKKSLVTPPNALDS